MSSQNNQQVGGDIFGGKELLLDASILLRLLVPDNLELKNEIVEFLENTDKELYSSALMKVELSNVLCRRIKDSKIIEDMYKQIDKLAVTYIPVEDSVLQQARKISNEVGDTVYDAMYHAHAILGDVIYLTLDKKYYYKAKHLGNVTLLTDVL